MPTRRAAKPKASPKRSSKPGTFGPEKRQAFLDAYASGLTVRQACKKVGISDMTISLTTRKDAEFKKAYEAAMDMNTDRLEDIVSDMAHNRNMVACFFLLKARRPQIYRDNHHVQVSASAETAAAFFAAMNKVQGSATAT